MIHAYCPAQPKNHTQEGIMDNRTKLDELLERVLAAQKEFDRLLAEKLTGCLLRNGSSSAIPCSGAGSFLSKRHSNDTVSSAPVYGIICVRNRWDLFCLHRLSTVWLCRWCSWISVLSCTSISVFEFMEYTG
jgi:hypothetical protein